MSTALKLTDTQHKRGCKAKRDEFFEAKRPNGEVVVIGRCLDCGESETHEQSLKEMFESKKGSKKENDD